jgi:putative nucleotidyltransferase with HDIG domain
MKSIRKIVQEIAKLKPMPQVAHKILAIQKDLDSSMDDLAKVVSHDAMTTANLLKAANTAYFARSKPIDSVQQAVVFLGMDEVVDLVLMSNSKNNLERGQKGYGLSAGDLWRNSVTSALISRTLSQKLGIANEHLVFTSALLKDIGKVVLEQYVAECAQEIMTLVEQRNYSFQEAEKDVIGIDHAQLGAMTAEVWCFSPEMVEIIKHHHQPANATMARQETVVVHLSDLLCMMMGISTGFDALAYRFDQLQIETIGLTDKDLQEIMADYAVKIEEIDDLVSSI